MENDFAAFSGHSNIHRCWMEAHCNYCSPNRKAFPETYWPDFKAIDIGTNNQEAIYTDRTTNHTANESDGPAKQTANVAANSPAYFATY